MDQNINNIKLNFSCNQNWDDMQDNTEGKFCSGCQKTVYDLTDKNAAYFADLLATQNQSICGRFSAKQMTQPKREEIWKKWMVAALVFVGFGSLMQKANAQTAQDKKLVSSPSEADCNQMNMLGEIYIVIMDPATKAGLNNIDKYLTNKFRGAPMLKGTLMISFNIGKNGELKNITANNKFMNGVNETTSQEVLRLLAKAPKLANYKQTELNINQIYSATLSFKNGRVVATQRM